MASNNESKHMSQQRVQDTTFVRGQRPESAREGGLLEVVRGPQRGQRRRRRLRVQSRGWVLRQRVPAEVQRRLEAAPARAAHDWLRLVDEPHVLPQVGRVAVPAPAHSALHPAARTPRRARAARCQQHHVRTAPHIAPSAVLPAQLTRRFKC